MSKIFRVKRFAKFPVRKANDKVMKEFTHYKDAQRFCIKLNETYNSHFYLEEIFSNENASAKS